MEHIITFSFGNATICIERSTDEKKRFCRIITFNVHGQKIDIVETEDSYLRMDHGLDIAEFRQEYRVS